MQYTTHNGTVLTLRRVDRRELDALFVQFPKPVPPVKTRKIWGGMEEKFNDHADAHYLGLYTCWLIRLSDAQLETMADGISLSVCPNQDPAYLEMKSALHLSGNEKINYLRYVCLNETDFACVTHSILYLSTVTQQGIDEAASIFAPLWSGQPIDTWAIKRTLADFSEVFEHRQAAKFALYNWNEFCSLSGPEQSAVVAQYRITLKLEQLEMRRQ